jgi:hypothetical protein
MSAQMPIAPGTAQLAAVATPRYPPTSRYYGIEMAATTRPDGTTVSYLRRRFIPSPERFELLQEITVAQGDRIDRLSARHLGDPEQYWRICDANNAMRPDDLERVGLRVRITLPEGIPGPAGV